MKIYIAETERFPDFLIVDNDNAPRHRAAAVDVEEATLARWRDAIKAYGDVQDEMEAAHNRVTDARRWTTPSAT